MNEFATELIIEMKNDIHQIIHQQFDLDSYTNCMCEHPRFIWYYIQGWFMIMCKECLLKETNI